jgi:hypothetical protein
MTSAENISIIVALVGGIPSFLYSENLQALMISRHIP